MKPTTVYRINSCGTVYSTLSSKHFINQMCHVTGAYHFGMTVTTDLKFSEANNMLHLNIYNINVQ